MCSLVWVCISQPLAELDRAEFRHAIRKWNYIAKQIEMQLLSSGLLEYDTVTINYYCIKLIIAEQIDVNTCQASEKFY